MNTGFGFSLISSYNSFPFLPTLVTKYLIERQPIMPWYYLAGIGVLNAIGFIIFRASESVRCQFAKDPSSAKAEGFWRQLEDANCWFLAGGVLYVTLITS